MPPHDTNTIIDALTTKYTRTFIDCQHGKQDKKDSSSKNAFFPSPHGPTLAGVAALLAAPTTRNVIILAGAGISTSASPPIPDFRTPGTASTPTLLPITYRTPKPSLTSTTSSVNHSPSSHSQNTFIRGTLKPALAHYFLALLQEKGSSRGCLRRMWIRWKESQGRGGEDRGGSWSFASSTCIECKKMVDGSG